MLYQPACYYLYISIDTISFSQTKHTAGSYASLQRKKHICYSDNFIFSLPLASFSTKSYRCFRPLILFYSVSVVVYTKCEEAILAAFFVISFTSLIRNVRGMVSYYSSLENWMETLATVKKYCSVFFFVDSFYFPLPSFYITFIFRFIHEDFPLCADPYKLNVPYVYYLYRGCCLVKCNRQTTALSE